MNAFLPAEILIPNVADWSAWAVVACDQYTSQPEYWARVDARTEGLPSTRHLILPEAQLHAPDVQQKIDAINAAMQQYLDAGLFTAYPESYVYVERTINSGAVRRGLIGMVDLEQYDFSRNAVSAVRATEGTVIERIPPRKRVREGAPIELPHILMLADDQQDALLASLSANCHTYQKLYDFDLMEQGGHITGWLVSAEDARAFDQRLADYSALAPSRYADLAGAPMVFAVGDGNHSLATAKTCYEDQKTAHPDADLSDHPARFALCELGNIHDAALEFEPIHRVITGVDAQALLDALGEVCAEEGYAVQCVTVQGEQTIHLDPARGELAVGILQGFLDNYLSHNAGEIDYIHGDEVTRQLASVPNAVGFLLPAMEKSQLFRGVIADGALPRKTFSMGHANEKRFYLEGRRIR